MYIELYQDWEADDGTGFCPSSPKAGRRANTDYVVEDHADHVLAAFKNQKEAIGCNF
jgi:hypothetical protein